MGSRVEQSVVIVEDDPSMRQALWRVLNAAGYAPVAYESAEAFMGDGNTGNATCLIFDVQLPGINGFELRERLARDGLQAPVIFITAYDEPEARERATRNGAVAYLAKPFAGRDLINAVMRAHGESPQPPGRRWRDGR